MNSKMLKIALASASGAVIGYGLSTMFLAGIWTLVASLVGGLIGWVLYDLRDFCKSLSCVLSDTGVWSGGICNLHWENILKNAMNEALRVFDVMLPVSTVMLYGYPLMNLAFGESALKPLPSYLFFLVIGLAVAFFIFITEVLSFDDKPSSGSRLTLKYVALTSPPVMPFVALYFIAKAIIRYTPPVMRFVWCVVVKTFVLAHNNSRLACALGGVIGTSVGVLAGRMLIAMLSGAIIGVSVALIGSLVPRDYTQSPAR